MSESAQVGPSEPPPPTLLVWAGFLAMNIGNFMALLDVQIVASSIGSIQAGVSASNDEISWVQTGYLIAEVIGIPLSGFLARALGARLLFSIAALSFSLASLMCALSWDLPSLVVFRAIQGFCGAPMVPMTMATTYLIIPRRNQMMAGAMMSMIMTVASSLGPTIGGWVGGAFGWRALFWVNLIPGPLVASTVWIAMTQLKGPEFSLFRKIDFRGLIGLAVFLGAAEYALEEGPTKQWFQSGEVTFWALTSLAGGTLFFWRALTVENPIVDLRPFRHVPFAIGTTLAFMIGVALFSAVFLTPLFLSSVRGYSSLQVGHTMFVQGLTMFIMGPLIGLLGRSGGDLRWLSALGLGFVAGSCFAQSQLTAEAGFWQFAVPQVMRGAGLMMSFTSIMVPAMQSLPPAMLHAGTSLFNTIRNLGGAFGIAGLSTIQAHAYALHRQELYAAADPSNPHVAAMAAGGRQAIMRYAGLLDREALVMTFNDEFFLMAVVISLSIVAVLFLNPKKHVTAAIAEPVQATH
jgi:MFS transporter, DHA2 family, multidrug resistance protein